MSEASLNDLLMTVGVYKKGAEAATTEIVNLTKKQATVAEETVKLLEVNAADNSAVTAAKAASVLETQAANKKAAAAYGTDLSATTNDIEKYAAEAKDAQADKTAALLEIEKKQSVSFFDAPLDYIVNQFTVNKDIAKHNIADARLESATGYVAKINALTQATAQTQVAIAAPLTAAAAEAATRVAATESLLQANKVKQEGLSYNINGITAALNSSKESLSLQFQTQNAINAEQQIKISLAHLEQNKKEFAQRQKEYTERDKDKEEQAKLGQSIVDTVNAGRVALLGPGSELDDVNGKMLLAQLKSKTPLSAQLQKFYEAGEAYRLSGIKMYGASPAQAAETMQTLPVQIPPVQEPVKNVIASATGEVSNALTNPPVPGTKNVNPAFIGLDKKDRNTLNRAVNVRAQQILDSYASVVRVGDSSNPYQIASVNQLAENSPVVKSLPVYQKVLKPLADTGIQLIDSKQIVSYVGDAVAKGTITHKEALELTTIYQVGVKTNMAMRNFVGFGLTPKFSYNAEVETAPGRFTSTEVVDMTKPDAVSRALIKLQSTKLTGVKPFGVVQEFVEAPGQGLANSLFGNTAAAEARKAILNNQK